MDSDAGSVATGSTSWTGIADLHCVHAETDPPVRPFFVAAVWRPECSRRETPSWADLRRSRAPRPRVWCLRQGSPWRSGRGRLKKNAKTVTASALKPQFWGFRKASSRWPHLSSSIKVGGRPRVGRDSHQRSEQERDSNEASETEDPARSCPARPRGLVAPRLTR